MHLTLHFFGSADDARAREIADALVQPIEQRPFDLSFDRLGLFPERGSPRVLWLGASQGEAELQRVHQLLETRLRLPPERETFTPHVTLARFRDRIRRSDLPEMARIPANAGPSRIDRVTLYESRLSPSGPAYVRVAEAPLHT
jgi:2'-5' RNA ligase